MKSNKPYGPFTYEQTRKFAATAVGAHEDSRNHRFDFDAVAEALQRKRFDSAQLWTELETYRLDKTDKHTYSLTTVEDGQ